MLHQLEAPTATIAGSRGASAEVQPATDVGRLDGSPPTLVLDSWTISVGCESCPNERADPFLARQKRWNGPLAPTPRDALAERLRDARQAAELHARILAVVVACPLPRVLVRKQWRYANGSLHTLTVALDDDHGGLSEQWYEEL